MSPYVISSKIACQFRLAEDAACNQGADEIDKLAAVYRKIAMYCYPVQAVVVLVCLKYQFEFPTLGVAAVCGIRHHVEIRLVYDQPETILFFRIGRLVVAPLLLALSRKVRSSAAVQTGSLKT